MCSVLLCFKQDIGTVSNRLVRCELRRYGPRSTCAHKPDLTVLRAPTDLPVCQRSSESRKAYKSPHFRVRASIQAAFQGFLFSAFHLSLLEQNTLAISSVPYQTNTCPSSARSIVSFVFKSGHQVPAILPLPLLGRLWGLLGSPSRPVILHFLRP